MTDDPETDREALRLNSLHRFRKHSPRLLLEEYSHCEVPAGCGGAVLRWVDPRTAIPAMIRMVAPDGREVELSVDGAPVDSGRLDLAPGPHVLGVALGRGEPGVFLMSVFRALARDDTSGGGAPLLLVSERTARWRLLAAPAAPPGWASLDFDDGGWEIPAEADEQPGGGGGWLIERLRDHGARALALPRDRCWLRARLRVPSLSPSTSTAQALPAAGEGEGEGEA